MLKCGFYESDITPPLGCSIPGYFRKRLGEDVRDRLYAKAACISDGKTEVAILSVDNVGFYSKIRAGIQKRVEENKYTKNWLNEIIQKLNSILNM